MAEMTQLERLNARRSELIQQEKKAFAESTESFPVTEEEKAELCRLQADSDSKLQAYQQLEQELKERKGSQKLIGEIKSVFNGHFKEEQQKIHEMQSMLPDLLDQLQEAEQALKECKEALYRKYRMEIHGGSFAWASCAAEHSSDVLRQAIGAEVIQFEQGSDGSIWTYAGKSQAQTRAIGYCLDQKIYQASGEACGYYKVTRTKDWAAVYRMTDEIVGWVKENGLICLDSYCGERTVEIGLCSEKNAFACGAQYLLFLQENQLAKHPGL